MARSPARLPPNCQSISAFCPWFRIDSECRIWCGLPPFSNAKNWRCSLWSSVPDVHSRDLSVLFSSVLGYYHAPSPPSPKYLRLWWALLLTSVNLVPFGTVGSDCSHTRLSRFLRSVNHPLADPVAVNQLNIATAGACLFRSRAHVRCLTVHAILRATVPKLILLLCLESTGLRRFSLV